MLGLIALTLFSCKEDKDKYVYDGPSLVFFVTPTGQTFYVEDKADATYPVIVGLTKPASKDLTFDVVPVPAETTATAGVEYTMPATVTILKGMSEGTFNVTGFFASLTSPTAPKLTLKINADSLAIYPINKKVQLTLKPFCPLTIDQFVGTFSATETRSGVLRHTTVVIEQKDATTLIVKAQAGIPGFLPSVFIGWGETFVTGHGLDGDIVMGVGLKNGQVTFEPGTYWGRTDYDYDYWYTGSGSWSGCSMTMNLTFRLHYDNLNFNDAGDRVGVIVIDLASKK